MVTVYQRASFCHALSEKERIDLSPVTRFQDAVPVSSSRSNRLMVKSRFIMHDWSTHSVSGNWDKQTERYLGFETALVKHQQGSGHGFSGVKVQCAKCSVNIYPISYTQTLFHMSLHVFLHVFMHEMLLISLGYNTRGDVSSNMCSDGVSSSRQHFIVSSVYQWPSRFRSQVTQDAVRAAKAAEHDCIDSLPWECRVPDAVQPLDSCAIHGHSQHAEGAAGGDGPVAAISSIQEAAVCLGGPYLPEDNSFADSGEICFETGNDGIGHL